MKDKVFEDVEQLSRKIHQLDCKQYQLKNDEPYWTKGNYDLLNEKTKEYDRIIARFILKNFVPIKTFRAVLSLINKKLDELIEKRKSAEIARVKNG